MPVEIRLLAPVGEKEDGLAVGRPAGIAFLIFVALGQLAGCARCGVDAPDVPAVLGQIARAVELVFGAGDVAGYHAQLLLLFVFLPFNRFLILLAELADELAAVGRPFKAANAALEVGQGPGLAAKGGKQVKLGLLFIFAVGEEGDETAVWRPARRTVRLIAIGELTGRLAAVSWHEP